MAFHSRLAPNSWVKESSLNDNRALRVTTGTVTPFGTGTVFDTVFPVTNKPIGGSINSVSATDTFNQTTVPAATLGAFNPFPIMVVQPATITNAKNATHNHQYDKRTPAVLSHAPQTGGVNSIKSQLEPVATGDSPAPGPGVFSHTHGFGTATDSHSHPVSVTQHGHGIASSGPHNHGFTTTAQNFNIKYVDIIICIKS